MKPLCFVCLLTILLGSANAQDYAAAVGKPNSTAFGHSRQESGPLAPPTHRFTPSLNLDLFGFSRSSHGGTASKRTPLGSDSSISSASSVFLEAMTYNPGGDQTDALLVRSEESSHRVRG
jgi:hypothetical protein